MARLKDALSRTRTYIDLLMDGSTPLVEVALDRAQDWSELDLPVEGERGGSSGLATIEERQERVRVARLASAASARIPEIVDAFDSMSRELYDTVQRLSAVVHPDRYPTDTPRCVSCARKQGVGSNQIGGHDAAIYEKSKRSGLCRWCWEYDNAASELPPVKACHLLHTQGPRAASLWLAKWHQVDAP